MTFDEALAAGDIEAAADIAADIPDPREYALAMRRVFALHQQQHPTTTRGDRNAE